MALAKKIVAMGIVVTLVICSFGLPSNPTVDRFFSALTLGVCARLFAGFVARSLGITTGRSWLVYVAGRGARMYRKTPACWSSEGARRNESAMFVH